MITPEQAVIAAVLLDSRVLRFAVDQVSPGDFEDQSLGAIFAGILSMAAAHEPVDVITVGGRLAAWEIRAVDDVQLHSWISEVPTASSVGAYAAKVREGSLRRGLQIVASRMVGATDPGVAISQASEQLKVLRAGASKKHLLSKTLGEVLLDDNDEYDWVVEGLLERKDRIILTGSEGAGKSTLVRQIALMTAAGLHPFTFFPMRPARVLVVDTENTERQWRRAVRPMVMKAATRGSVNPADAVHLACTPRLDLSKDSDLGEVHSMIDELRPDILFIGPLYRLIPRAINSDDDAAPLLAALDTLRDRGLAMVIEAHAGHAQGHSGERDLRPRGSAALMGWPEFGLGLSPDRRGAASNAFKLVRWRGDRDERKWPSRISRGISDWPWTPTVGF